MNKKNINWENGEGSINDILFELLSQLGITRFMNWAEGKLRKIQAQDGFFDNKFYCAKAIEAIESGFYWIGGDGGICVGNKETGNFYYFNECPFCAGSLNCIETERIKNYGWRK